MSSIINIIGIIFQLSKAIGGFIPILLSLLPFAVPPVVVGAIKLFFFVGFMVISANLLLKGIKWLGFCLLMGVILAALVMFL